ncbi:MAG: SUMF1/EgtB/PvdO family nonheme iron enzyme [Phycisphaerae bacterium]|jgi:formylglycine-generating enzyme required for sulfatase activity|nr:SUMF1/EgtB/PvdO family nonheme iron enzyme [Phycisphaerae bacterium]
MQAAVSAARNPKGPSSGTFRVVRGGSWGSSGPALFRAANRGLKLPGGSGLSVGFRCAKDP